MVINNKKESDKNELVISRNSFIYKITYILYRYSSSYEIGNQFIGAFEKK